MQGKSPPGVFLIVFILPDARWFSRDEVRAVLDHKAGTKFNRADYKRLNEITDGRSNTEEKAPLALAPAEATSQPPQPEPPAALSDSDEPPFRLPPVTAIAGVLIRDWVDGKIGFPPEENALQKGNL